MVFVFTSHVLIAQNVISGKVFNTEGEIVAYANITVSEKNKTAILAYALTDARGEYKLQLASPLDSVVLKVSHIGHSRSSKKIVNKSQVIDFELEKSTLQLNEVTIDGKSSVLQTGDTIRYKVDSFKKNDDRTIADVLEKLPGIEVESNGRILYQGKAIQKYYIEGLDLLEGRYNLANSNLPVDAVSQVQVLENHQPIQLLDSLIFSDRASLNIKLKNNSAFALESQLGVGLAPALWNANITPMLFTKKRQLIASYQSNNTGHDVSKQLRRLTIDELSNGLHTTSENWLDIQTIAPPPFSEIFWLTNSIHMGTVNYLNTLGDNYNIKYNIDFVTDDQTRSGSTETSFFTPTDTITINEIKHNSLSNTTLRGNVTLEKNDRKHYLKNQLRFKKHWNTKNQQLITTRNQTTQDYVSPLTSLENKFRYLFPSAKKILSLKSYVSYFSNDQSLVVNPGQFEDLLNNSQPFDEVNQRLQHDRFFTDNSLNATFGVGRFTFSSQTGFSIGHDQLSSALIISDSSTSTVLSNEFQNNLTFNKSQAYIQTDAEFASEGWVFKVKLPLKYHFIEYRDENLTTSPGIKRPTFEPRLSIYKKLNTYWRVNISGQLKYDFGQISQQYRGYILTGYRTTQKNNSDLLITKRQVYTAGLEFKDVLNSTFGNVNYYFTLGERNLIPFQLISNTGITETQTFNIDNTIQSHHFNMKVDKTLDFIKSNIALQSTYNQTKSKQFLNDQVYQVTNESISLKPTLFTDISKWITTEYKGSFTLFSNQVGTKKLRQIVTQSHSLNLILFLSDFQIFEINGEYFTNNFSTTPESYFLNLSYQYTLQKSKIDLELKWNNILNTKSYNTIYSNPYTYISNTYEVRPSQLIFNIKFGIR